MRQLLVAIALFAATAAGFAADAPGRVIKVLPLLLDLQGRDALSPSLFDRDAYQARLRQQTNAVSAIRFDVLWSGERTAAATFKLRAELRGIRPDGTPHLQTLETNVAPGWFHTWTPLLLGGDDYRHFGSLAAWRVTLWQGDQQVSEQKSFLW
jgi:hypothetical protein